MLDLGESQKSVIALRFSLFAQVAPTRDLLNLAGVLNAHLGELLLGGVVLCAHPSQAFFGNSPANYRCIQQCITPCDLLLRRAEFGPKGFALFLPFEIGVS